MSKYFLASVKQTTASDKITADKNGNLPFACKPICGEVILQNSDSQICLLNGTVGKKAGVEPGSKWICSVFTEDYEGSLRVRVEPEELFENLDQLMLYGIKPGKLEATHLQKAVANQM